MEVMAVVVVLLMAAVVAAFWFGLKTGERHAYEINMAVTDALNRQYVRLMAGVDADDPNKPYVVPEKFYDKLQTSGQAVMKLDMKAK